MVVEIRKKVKKMKCNAVKTEDKLKEDVTFTCWSFISLSMTVMIKSLARAKFVEPILSELSTMNARSSGAHLHSGDTHMNNFIKANRQSSYRQWRTI